MDYFDEINLIGLYGVIRQKTKNFGSNLKKSDIVYPGHQDRISIIGCELTV